MGRPQCGQISTSLGTGRSQAIHFGLGTESSLTHSPRKHKDKRNVSHNQHDNDQSSATNNHRRFRLSKHGRDTR